MQPPDNTEFWASFWRQLWEPMWGFVFAIYGGFAQMWMSNGFANKRPGMIVFLLMANCLTAGFAGLMGYLLAQEMGLSARMAYVISGMAGYSGGKFLEQLQVRILQKIGGKTDGSNS